MIKVKIKVKYRSVFDKNKILVANTIFIFTFDWGPRMCFGSRLDAHNKIVMGKTKYCLSSGNPVISERNVHHVVDLQKHGIDGTKTKDLLIQLIGFRVPPSAQYLHIM